MSSTLQKTSKSGRQSLFFRDLASPVTPHRGKFATPGQAAAVSALWRENFGGVDPPPPPVFTLEDRTDFSPESGLSDYPMSPEIRSEKRTPGYDSISPLKTRPELASTSYAAATLGTPEKQHNPGSSMWWSPGKGGGGSRDHDDMGKGSAVDGVVQPGALVMLPPPMEVARPDLQRISLPAGDLIKEEWVTVYGFSPGDTNFVLREYEKFGVILKHVPGPRDANWMHILYQNQCDAQKALRQNGMQINGVLIVGVKPLDPSQRQYLNEKLNNKTQGFMVLPPQQSSGSPMSRPSPRPYYLRQASTDVSRSSVGAIASPAKSMVSKVMDLMFGI